MGPPSKRDGSTVASATLRSEPQLSPALSTDQLEWSSPTYIRARSRPGNLHSYMRSNSGLASSAGASPRPYKAPGSATSSSNGGASPKHQRPSKVRSQSTRSTQTNSGHADQESDSSQAPLLLGSYGDVRLMPIETVDMLITALETRREELQRESATEVTDTHRRERTLELETKPRRSAKKASDRANSSDVATRDALPVVADRTELLPPAPTIVRSRSYEALMQLEQILEARHQQLLHDGTFDECSSLSLRGCSESDLKEEIRKLQQSIRRDHGAQQQQER